MSELVQKNSTQSVVKKISELGQREQFLIIFLIMTLLVGGYMVFQYKGKTQELAVADERFQQIKVDVSSFRSIKPIKGSPRVEQAKIEQLTDKYTQIAKLIKTAEKDLVDLQDARAVESRWVDVSNLMKSNSLFVLNRFQHEKDIGGVYPYLRGQEQDSILQRPMQSITVKGRFSGFYRFLSQIKNLDWTLSVLQLELEIVDPGANPEIQAKFILAI